MHNGTSQVCQLARELDSLTSLENAGASRCLTSRTLACKAARLKQGPARRASCVVQAEEGEMTDRIRSCRQVRWYAKSRAKERRVRLTTSPFIGWRSRLSAALASKAALTPEFAPPSVWENLHATRDVSTLLLEDQLLAEASSTRLVSDQRGAIQTAGAKIWPPCRVDFRDVLKLRQVSV